MFIINWRNLASLVTSSEANQLYTCRKMQNFAFDDIISSQKICTVHLLLCLRVY